jgi:hypothetical protein
MKKNKKVMNVTPESATTHERGSVGEFIELLKEFPADGRIDLYGNVAITTEEPNGGFHTVAISPQCAEYRDGTCDECKDNCVDLESEESVEEAKESFANYTMNKFDLGFEHANHKMIPTLRYGTADKLLGAPIMKPNSDAFEYEDNYLLPNQREIIDEIRHHNVYMAECMAELCRRGVSAMLEYNTQVISHFARETTKDMCKIIDKGTASKVLGCIDDEEF